MPEAAAHNSTNPYSCARAPSPVLPHPISSLLRPARMYAENRRCFSSSPKLLLPCLEEVLDKEVSENTGPPSAPSSITTSAISLSPVPALFHNWLGGKNPWPPRILCARPVLKNMAGDELGHGSFHWRTFSKRGTWG